MSPFVLGALASFMASLGTGFGALPVLFVSTVSQRRQDLLLSLAAGTMLAATAFSLVSPAIEDATAQLGGAMAGTAAVGVSFFLGALAVLAIHRYAPHEHLLGGGRQGPMSPRLRRAWLIVIALTLHNLPEGMAVGVGFGDLGEIGRGFTLGTAIFLQNIPEGFVVGLALVAQGYSRTFSVLVAFATGMVETMGGITGAGLITLSGLLLPYVMAFAGGAMFFVVNHEILPETHRSEFALSATFGVMGGFVLMLLLDAAFV